MIHINPENREFHLQTKSASYIMKVAKSGHLLNLYYGKKIKHRDNFSSLEQSFGIAVGNATTYHQDDPSFDLDTEKLEFPTFGKGDYREVIGHFVFDDGSRISDFHYHSHQIIDEKPELAGLPHTFGTGLATLVITLHDPVIDAYVELYYTPFDGVDGIARSLKLVNGNKTKVWIDKLMSFNLDFNGAGFEVISLEGKWIKERHINRCKLNKGVFMIDSKRGVSSANHNPFLCLAGEGADEYHGDCYGFGLIYSGNHQGIVEVNAHDFTRVQMGINPFDFDWTLNFNESFQTPEVIMTYSGAGLNQMSQNFHNLIKNHLIDPAWQYKERPIVINNWEATYFQFDEAKLIKLAKAAKELGIELFVLDDGWFGNRNDDTTSLGDWFENVKKLPNGLEGLSQKIKDIGLDFGLWVEPEAVSIDSELYREHPDWVIQYPQRKPSLGRHQLVLDLANPGVTDHLFKTLSDIFTRARVSYVKWDLNRNFSDHYSANMPKDRQRELHHRYVLGLYSLLDRLKKKFPQILFESCSSGGNRFDLGMLYYMPQTWTSDNTDAVERLSIQYGTSLIYPPSTMCAHVNGSISHQVLRVTPVETRFNTAAFGLLGFSLDVTKLSNFDKNAIKAQIKFYKEHRKLLQFGDFYRLKSPFDTNNCIWMVVSPAKDEAVLGYYQKLQQPNPGLEIIQLKGLDEETLYQLNTRLQYLNIKIFGELINDYIPFNIKEGGIIHNIISENYMFELEKEQVEAYGDEFMNAGFRPKAQFNGMGYNERIRFIGDFGSRLYYIKKQG
jgi:alpha-galactosidase